MNVLFLCTDNFTRSVTAELCLKNYLKINKITDIHVASAGFKSTSDLSGFSSVHFDRLKEIGVDTSGFVRTQFQESFIDEYDSIIGMGEEHKNFIYQEYGKKICLFNEVYNGEFTSVTIPPPDKDGRYLTEIKNMVDYIYNSMPVFVKNLYLINEGKS